MPVSQLRMAGSRRNFIVSVFAAVFAVSGVSVIAVALVAQDDAPQPPPSAAGNLEPSLLGPRAVSTDQVLPESAPIAIEIPAIGVQSKLQYVGLTPENTMEVPQPGPHYDEAAWYKYSPPPGSRGSAVIVGHVDSVDGGPSVFFKLGDMGPGDEVRVRRADGHVAVFVVDGVRSFPKDPFPGLLVYGDTGQATLRLITCGGGFDDATGHYLENIVVFATLVDIL